MDFKRKKTGNFQIIGTGRALPSKLVQSSELDEIHGFDHGYLKSKTGVLNRYFCNNETQIDLAIAAANLAISNASIAADNIDLIISASAVPFQPIPATAPAIQRGLGIGDGNCFAMDINCTCLGFPAALHFANGISGDGSYSNILIVCSELASRGLPWKTQPEVAGLFGDGAAAAVLNAQDSCPLFSALFETHSSAYDSCSLAAGGTRFDFAKQPDMFAAHSQFTMDGKELFRITAKHFSSFVEQLLTSAGLQRQHIDRVIPHQASPSALAHMIKLCGFESEQIVNIASEVGNQIAASIPFTLDYASEKGLIKKGDQILMLGTSAGVSFGGIAMEY